MSILNILYKHKNVSLLLVNIATKLCTEFETFVLFKKINKITATNNMFKFIKFNLYFTCVLYKKNNSKINISTSTISHDHQIVQFSSSNAQSIPKNTFKQINNNSNCISIQ